MMTKEQMLKKGIDPATADEILAGMVQDNDSPLQALRKAMSGDDFMKPLFKAGKEKADDDDDDKEPDDDGDDYDEEYMKKYMKKFMKANKAMCKADAEEVGLFDKEMKKALEGMDFDTEGAVVEMTDLSPFLDAQSNFNSSMAKAILNIANRLEVIAEQNAEGYSLLHKASAVQVEVAEIISGISKTPNGRKGVVMADLSKATNPALSGNINQTAYVALAKAVTAGDMVAGEIGSKFESSGKRFDFLNPQEQTYVNELIKKEAN